MSVLEVKTTGINTAEIFLDGLYISDIVSNLHININPSNIHTATITIIPDKVEISGDLAIKVKEMKEKYGKDTKAH